MTIYQWIIVACWAVFLIYWMGSWSRTKANARPGFGLRGLLLRIAAIALIAVIASRWNVGIVYQNFSVLHPYLSMLGCVCAIVGIGFAVWARVHLGANWGMPMTVKENPELVTSGPYAYVRHPIYTGVLFALFGAALVNGPWWFVIFGVGCLYFIYSATQEEKIMREKFPAAYPEYRARTKMIVPFVF